MAFDHGTRQVQTQPRALKPPGQAVIELTEGLEHQWHVRFADANSGITDGEGRLSPVHPHSDGYNATWPREFDGVGQQLRKHSHKAPFISPYRGHIVFDADGQAHAGRSVCLFSVTYRIARQRSKIGRALDQIKPPRLKARHVENDIDHA